MLCNLINNEVRVSRSLGGGGIFRLSRRLDNVTYDFFKCYKSSNHFGIHIVS